MKRPAPETPKTSLTPTEAVEKLLTEMAEDASTQASLGSSRGPNLQQIPHLKLLDLLTTKRFKYYLKDCKSWLRQSSNFSLLKAQLYCTHLKVQSSYACRSSTN